MGSSTTQCPNTICGRTWTAQGEAHCVACHQHFGGPSLFDVHQREGRCLTPRELRSKGLRQKRDRFGGRTWRRPPGDWRT